MRSKPITYSKEAEAKINEKWVTLEDIKKCLQDGEVDFDKSNKPFEQGKLYIIEGKNANNEAITVEMINYTERVVLKDVKKQ